MDFLLLELELCLPPPLPKLGQDDAKLLAEATEPDVLWPDWCAVWVPEGPGNIFLTMEVK